MNRSFDELLSDGDMALKNGISSLAANLGKAVAVITLFVASLVTFTDISFGGIRGKGYFAMLAVMVMSAYLMYFSLLDVGEKRGEESEEYKAAKKRFDTTRVKITGDMMPRLRSFCEEYSRRELEERRRYKLMSYGLSEKDKTALGNDRRKSRIFKRAERMKTIPLSVRTLLSCEKRTVSSELSDPERGRFLRSFASLIPSAVCMCVTVSFVLNIKDGMSAADIINGILKLCSLPIIGIRGYTAGIFYSAVTKASWTETKARILESFLETSSEAEKT